MEGLREHAGVRARVVDDHNFLVPRAGYGPAAFRLQLFTAAGLRPVAVATQTSGDGASLVNGAERYVEAVWTAYCPDEPEPPIFIARQLTRVDGTDQVELGFQHIDFQVDGVHSVASPPRWGRLLGEEEVAELVGASVALDRGDGYVPRPPSPEPRMQYAAVLAVLLPAPRLENDDLQCMRAGIRWPSRLARQLMPSVKPSGCCWYHGGNWRTVARAARRILRTAKRDGIEDDDLAVYGLGQADERGFSRWERDALRSLFLEPIQPSLEVGGYIGGRHRALAVLHAGVRRIPVVRWHAPIG